MSGIRFICTNCGRRTTRPDRGHQSGLRRKRLGCDYCGSGMLFELMEDYYPAPGAAFFVCDQKGLVLGCGRGAFELTGLRDEKAFGRDVREVLGLQPDDGTDPVGTALEWGVRQLGKAASIHADGDLPARVTLDCLPAYDDDGGVLLVLTPAG